LRHGVLGEELDASRRYFRHQERVERILIRQRNRVRPIGWWRAETLRQVIAAFPPPPQQMRELRGREGDESGADVNLPAERPLEPEDQSPVGEPPPRGVGRGAHHAPPGGNERVVEPRRHDDVGVDVDDDSLRVQAVWVQLLVGCGCS